jgi:adenine deaminase
MPRNIDVVIDRDRIVDLGDCRHWQADTCLDAAGLVLAPGFIDSHTHDDLAVLKTPDIPFKISQGVTTVIAGNCGISVKKKNSVFRRYRPIATPSPVRQAQPTWHCLPGIAVYASAAWRTASSRRQTSLQ